MTDIIRKLSTLDGISGRETAVCAYLYERLQTAPAVEAVSVDRIGNCLVRLKGKKRAAHTVVFAAHMDEVGGIVTDITDEGYLRFHAVGGVSPAVLFSHRVTVNGHTGIIGGKAVHQCRDKEKTEIPSADTLLIDIGATTREEAEACVLPGDPVYFDSEYTELQNGCFKAKALDDRVGCALLLKLALTEPEYDVTIAFTVQEEIGLRGAAVAGFNLQPEFCVVVDATTAADTAGVPEDKQVCCMGGGPVISGMDGRTMYDKPLYDFIFRLADKNDIPAQTKTAIAGGNDAGSFQSAGIGSRVAAISLPCRYIHSPACVLNDTDVKNTYRLLSVLFNSLPGETGV